MAWAMANDEEYIQAQIDAAGNTAQLSGGGKVRPVPLHQWGSQHELLRRLIGEVEALKIVTIRVNSKKGSQAPEPRPVPGPVGIMAELLKRKRISNHLNLRARLLPKKYGNMAEKSAEQTSLQPEETTWDRSTSVRRR